MTKTKILRNVAAVAVCLAAAILASCDIEDETQDVATDGVSVTIANLPNETNGMGGQVIVYTTKPVQYAGIPDGIATGTLMNGTTSYVLLGDPRTENYIYQGGEAYLMLSTIPRAGVDQYFHFITKNKVTLHKGDNAFDFRTDFEILHDYGGSNGILRIEGVPDVYEGSISIMIYDYPYIIGEEGTYTEAIKTKPLGCDGIADTEGLSYHAADYLALPLAGFTNQKYNTTIDDWTYEPTGKRFNLSGLYFIDIAGFRNDCPINQLWYYYADQVQFTNGKATIQWSDLKKVVYYSD
jgi:hypothetical protein